MDQLHTAGRSFDAWAAVTSSGVVAVGIINQKPEMVVTRTALETFEDRMLKCADIVLEANGSLQILSTTGRTKDPIRLHKLSVDITSSGYYIQPGQCLITCDCFSAFFVDKCTEVDRISSVQCVQPMSSSAVLVAIDKPHGTEIQQWSMCEETLGLHTAFHANTIIPEKNLHWVRQTSVQFPSCVTAYATSPLLTDNTSLFPFGSAFACDDLDVRLISRLSLNDAEICSSDMTNEYEKIVSLAISPNGCVCVAMTSECRMLLFGRKNVTVEELSTLLEYDICTGVTCEDTILCLRSDLGLADKVSQNLLAGLSKQARGLQAQLSTRMDMMKVALSMSNEAGLVAAADHLTALLLHHTSQAFIAVLSSSAYDESDQNAEEKFRWLLGQPGNNAEQDVDKLLSMLEPLSDFLPDESKASSLQPLVQWVCDLTMTLLSSIPMQYNNYPASSGSWLLKDINSLSTLRELILLTRLWYNAVPRIRPVLSCSTSFDALARIFQLLTQLILSLREGISMQISLIDECILLSNELVLPPFERSICWSELPVSISLDRASKHAFGEQAGSIGCLKVPSGQYTTNGRKDIYTQIAINTEEYKRCIRCNAVTLLTWPASEQKNRFNVTSHYCICGGLWCLNT
ncbi:mediator of RNA polymerase II transcription subunit 16-like isoform X2 [Watersipora subatra]|uniref:mediator of RNA polymerase II transcription subunit 16-like isoform X2 n=1 Tax=Watersipora subatra TaxID=2589382 RepID=UPI00355C07FC